VNPDDLLKLEAELKKDLDAISRVRKMMASKNGAVADATKTIVTLPSSTPTSSVSDADDDEDDLDEGPVTSLRGTVERVVNSDPNKQWTTQRVLDRMRRDGFDFKAQKPIYSVGQALQKLAQRHRIRRTRKGTGSSPNIYRAKDSTAEEQGGFLKD
jgi:hypothetical protein